MSSEIAVELAPLPPVADAKTIAMAFDFAMQDVNQPANVHPIRLVFAKVGDAARVTFFSGDAPLHDLLDDPSASSFARAAVETFTSFARSFCAEVKVTDSTFDASPLALRWFGVREVEVKLHAALENDGKRVSRYLRNAWVNAVDAKTAQLLAIARLVEDGTVVSPGNVVEDDAPPAERVAGEGPVILTGRIFFSDS